MIRRRLAKAVWVFLLALALLFLGGDTLGGGSVALQLSRPHLFNLIAWHIQNIPARWSHDLATVVRPAPAPATEAPLVQNYFQVSQEVGSLKARALREASTGGVAIEGNTGTQSQLARATTDRNAMRFPVERSLEDLLSETLTQQGLTTHVLATNVLWPPVYLRLSDMPRVLVVSPRDHIQVLETHLLSPNMSPNEIQGLEESIHKQGLSALVEDIGGVATYPSMVPDNTPLKAVLEEVSHEWTHQYLFFRPLGQGYWSNSEMTVINETVADLAGRELGDDLYRQYFASKDNTPPAATPEANPTSAPTFDFNAFMRETRLTTDQLLALGEVERAEQYMETQRQALAAHGYFIRKLNQAYFAFHGNYAEREGSINPVGGYVRAIRTASPDLKTFLENAARWTSQADLVRDYQALPKVP